MNRSVKRRRKDWRLFNFIFSTARGADKRIGRDPLVNHPDSRGFPLETPPPRARTREADSYRYLSSGTGLVDFLVPFSPAGGKTKNQGALTAVKLAGAV